MKKILALVLALILTLSLGSTALAVNEDVEGELVIYSSMNISQPRVPVSISP